MNKAGRGLALAVVAAFGTGMLAIAEHARQVELGYRLAAARAESDVLRREAHQAERRVAMLRLPQPVAERASAMNLSLEHPRDRRILTSEQVALLVAPPVVAPPVVAPPQLAAAEGVPTGVPTRAPGVMAK